MFITGNSEDKGIEWGEGGDYLRFLFSEESRLDLGPTQLSIRYITAGICMGVKQMGHERQHPSSSSSKVKHERYITVVNTYSACREKSVIYG